MLKRSSDASRKTRYETSCQAQENLRARKWLLPDKIKALPAGERVGRARTEVRLQRPQAEKAPVPLDLDRAHRRRRQAERHQLQPVRQRAEEGWHRVGPQDPRGPGGEGRRGIYGAVRAGQGRARSFIRSVTPSIPGTICIPAMGGLWAARCALEQFRVSSFKFRVSSRSVIAAARNLHLIASARRAEQ